MSINKRLVRTAAVAWALAWALSAAMSHAQCPPSSPGGLDASDGDYCARIALTWNAPPGGGVGQGISWYEVWRSTGTDYSQANRIANGVLQTSYDDSLVIPGEFYYYWITAWRVACLPGENRSAPSARNQGRTGEGLAPPPVASLTAASGCGQVDLSWPEVPGTGVTYRISRNFSHLATTPLLQYTDFLFGANAEVVNYEVIPVSGCGVMGTRTIAENIRLHSEPPHAPGSVSASGGVHCEDVRISWVYGNTDLVDSFEIWRAPPGGGVSQIGITVWYASSYVDAGAVPGVEYTYVVRAVNTCGASAGGFATALVDCPADLNCSGTLTVQDIFDFLAAYFAGDPLADFNDSGALSVQDIFDFLAAYFAGCS